MGTHDHDHDDARGLPPRAFFVGVILLAFAAGVALAALRGLLWSWGPNPAGWWLP